MGDRLGISHLVSMAKQRGLAQTRCGTASNNFDSDRRLGLVSAKGQDLTSLTLI
jgi:hypothetical protein